MNTLPPHTPDPGEDAGLRRGDHIRAGRPWTAHHDGIYLGDGSVIHLTGGTPEGGKAAARVQIDPLARFAAGRPVTIQRYFGAHNPEEVVARAMSRLGEGNYNLIFNNCQHFARWSATGDQESEQVRSVTATTATVITPALATALTGTVIAPAGLVSGLSGPGIMSGLAAYGALAGGGAVAGLVILGTAPALTSVTIMNHALRHDDNLPRRQRTARTAGRIGSAAGAVAGMGAGVAAVSALGVPGLGAAGISSGLAAVGAAATGGGMAVGAACVIAAPAAAAAIFGYLIYRLALWLASPTPPATDTSGPVPSAG
ncbi:MAG TPA: lecithin retinol acyltransferase family protein [Streptosporangiaceae bacterium]|nr:lecithin retinol acyltransferase family protein [Streptosporangiaceae bacterium]